MIKFIRQLALGAACFALSAGVAGAWSLEEAAKPYKGTEISVIFLDRPGYRAIMKMLPDFEQKTGIKVKYEIVPYESTLEKEVRDFSSNRSEEHTSELQSHSDLVCRLLLEKKKQKACRYLS